MPSKRIVLLFLGFLVLLLGTTWFVLQRSGASEAFVRQILDKSIPGDFDLDAADVDLAQGTLTLRGFALRRPDGSAAAAVERVQLGIDAGLGIRDVTVEGWTLDVDLSGAGATINAWELLQLSGDGEADIPAVTVTNSRINVRYAADRPPIVLDNLALTVLPTADGSEHVIAGSARAGTQGTAIKLTIRGRGNPNNESFRVDITTDNVALNNQLVSAWSPDIASALADRGVAATLHKGAFWIGREPGADIVARADFDVRDLSAIFAEFPYPIDGARAQVSWSTADGGTARARLESAESTTPLTIRVAATALNDAVAQGTTPPWQVRVESDGIPVDAKLADAVATLGTFSAVWDSLQPVGGALALDVLAEFDPARHGPQSAPMDLRGTVEVLGVSGRYIGFQMPGAARGPGFPVPLDEVTGTVVIRDSEVELRDIRGQLGASAGGGDLSASGLINVGGEQPTMVLDIHGDEVTFHPGVRAAVGELLREDNDPGRGTDIWDTYSPVGEGQVDVHLTFDDWRVDVRPEGAAVTWREFPHKIEDLRGLIRIEDEGVALDVTGRPALADGTTGQPLALDARFRAPAAPNEEPTQSSPASEFRLVGKGVELTEEVQQALAVFSPALGEQWSVLRPKGASDFELLLWQAADSDPFHYDVRIDLKGAAMQFRGLPIPVDDLTGALHVHGFGESAQLDIDRVRGTLNLTDAERSASVLAQGSVGIREGGVASQEITAAVQDLELTDQLATALADGDVFPRDVWDILLPAGRVNCVFHRSMADGAARAEQRMKLTLRGVSSHAAMLPGPATAIEGTVDVHNGNVTFGALTAQMKGVEIQCLSGGVTTGEDAVDVRATVRSMGEFPVDDSWSNLLSGPLRDAFLAREIRGRAQFNELRLNFRFPKDNPESFRTEITGQIALGEGSLNLGTRVESLVGIVQLEKALFDGGVGIVEGFVRDVDLNLLGHPIEEFSSGFSADAGGVTFRNVRCSFYDGTVRGTEEAELPLRYEFADGGRFQGNITFANLTLSRLLRGAGYTGTPYRGVLGGRVQLEELRGGDFLGMRGHGNLQVVDADLGTVPIFTAIYAYVVPDRRPKFDEASFEFSVADRVLTLEQCNVGSPFLGVTGSGTLSLNGYVDMVLRVEDLLGSGQEWLIVPELLDIITKNVVRFHVYGHLRTVKARPRFVLQSDPDYQRLSPIPPPRRERNHPGF